MAVMLQSFVFVYSLPLYLSAVLQDGVVHLHEAGPVSPTNKSKLAKIWLFFSLTDLNGCVFNVLYINVFYSENEMKL